MVLKVENLVVGYNDKPLLSPISFEVENGDRVAITGFNGIGKSTLLKTIIGLIPKFQEQQPFQEILLWVTMNRKTIFTCLKEHH